MDFSLYSRAYPASSYPTGTRSSFLGVKQPGHEADYSSPSKAEVMNGGAIPPLPVFMAYYLPLKLQLLIYYTIHI
jgi:hypothetical protein